MDLGIWSAESTQASAIIHYAGFVGSSHAVPPLNGDPELPGELVGCKKDKGKGRFLPELDPDNGYDVVDHTLTVAYLNSRYGQGIDYADEQSRTRESLYEPERLEHAKKVLDTLSVREIEKKCGIPRTTASRAKKAVQELTKAANGIQR